MQSTLTRWRHAWMAGVAALAFGATAQAAAPAPAAPYTVVNASFACQTATCDAELWLPKGVSKPPVILMAHGFGALKDWGLQPFAERFVKAGFAVVRFDYRGFGKSGGLPRRVVNGPAQVKDWLSAIDAVRLRGDVDGSRIGLWGSSFSGGLVLVAASQSRGVVKAVSSQVPFVNGFQSALTYPLKYQPRAAWDGLRDLMRSDKDEPIYIPIVAKDAFAALVCAECVDGYGKLVTPGQEAENKVAARILMTLPWFAPASSAPHIAAPVLVVAAENDGLIPVKGVREMVKALPQGEYLELKGADHFAPYALPAFEQVVSRQTAFFLKNLAR
ncbi:alpha/beta hydrolase [Aquabacterium sp.]|uniref:alpha/beta hydrolase n=1 Tax=Aquabacterium sp. TaxID=1872578 RepID=UPI003D6D3429